MPTQRMVTKRIEIGRPRDVAFKLFTERMADWWPFDSHSIFEAPTVDVVVEPGVGGEIYEVTESGERGHWATILEWDPPHSLTVA